MNRKIAEYVNAAPEEHRKAMKEIDAIIDSELPNATIEMDSGFPVYSINGKWVSGFASRKKGVMFYLMNSAVQDKYEKKLGRLRTGKSCIAYHPTKSITIPDLRTIMRKMLQEAKKQI